MSVAEPTQEVAVMSFREHLGELRTRIVRIAAALIIGFFIGWEFKQQIFDLLSSPITNALADNGLYHYQAISIAESIIVYLKAVLIADLIVMSPWVFYQLWSFVSPGLHDHERKFVLPVTAFSVVFFAIGVAFSYQVILPFITDWLVKLTLESGGVTVMVTMQNAFSTAFTFLLMFGLAFQLPLVIFFLTLFGATGFRGLLKFWRYFVVLSFLISAILTPPDPISQVLMALPLNALYGFGILVAWVVERTRRDDASAVETGVSAMRLMLAGLVLIGVAVALVILFVGSLPATPLDRLMPERTAWVMGLNPSVLHNDKGEPLDTLMRGGHAAGTVSKALSEASVPAADVARAVIYAGPDDERVAVLRHEGLGAHLDALVEALPAKDSLGRSWAVSALDENTLAFGERGLLEEVVAVAAGEADSAARHDEDRRLIRELSSAGPVWAWLPAPTTNGQLVFGEAAAETLYSAGGFVSIERRRADDVRVRLTLKVRGEDMAGGDMLEARIDAARMAIRAASTDAWRVAVVEVLRSLADEVRREGGAVAADRLARADTTLRALEPGANAKGTLPVFRWLGAKATGWSLRREEQWVLLSTDIDSRVEQLFLPERPKLLDTGTLGANP